MGKALRFLLFLIPLLALFVVLAFRVLIPSVQLANKPEQVEIVGKRTSESFSTGSRRSRPATYYTFIVSFNFPDGSVKEFAAGKTSQKIGSKQKACCSEYDSLHEGDTGILIYKEIANIEKK